MPEPWSLRPTVTAAIGSLLLAACGAPRAAERPTAHAAEALKIPPLARSAAKDEPASTARAEPDRADDAAPPARPPRTSSEHWYFESLSPDGKRALLRELDPRSRSTFHVRVVDVDDGTTIEEATLPEVSKIPSATIGGKPTELSALEWMLASPAFARDLAEGARIASLFPFGECGRLAAATRGAAIAFDAGDWLYTADGDGRVRRRLAEEAAYDPRFTPDGKHLLFRRVNGKIDTFAKYDVFVVPSDLSAPPRAVPGTAGMRDRFTMHPDGNVAFAVASRSRAGRTAQETCVLSLSLKPPFGVKRLACIDASEQLVESVVSPRGKWAALSTKRVTTASDPSSNGLERRLEWRLRVMSLTSGKVVRDEPEVPGLAVRAISDSGLLVESGALGAVVHDVPGKKWRELAHAVDLGYRGFFRNDKELVYVSGGGVDVLDVTKD